MRMAIRPILPDLAYTLGARRNHHPYRVTLAARSIGEVISELNGYAKGQKDSKVRMGFAPRRTHLPRVAFVMSGQGPQWWGMGRDLFQHEPVFQETIERCDSMMRPWGSFSLMEELGRSEEVLPNASNGNCAASHFCDAGRAGEIVEILGRSAGCNRWP